MDTMSKTSRTPSYFTIAQDIARRIAREQFRVDEKLSGRSTLAALYQVSPETVRKAIALLEDWGVVHAYPGSGVLVRSRERALDFLAHHERDGEFEESVQRLAHLLQERRRIDREIEQIIERIIGFVSLRGRS